MDLLFTMVRDTDKGNGEPQLRPIVRRTFSISAARDRYRYNFIINVVHVHIIIITVQNE